MGFIIIASDFGFVKHNPIYIQIWSFDTHYRVLCCYSFYFLTFAPFLILSIQFIIDQLIIVLCKHVLISYSFNDLPTFSAVSYRVECFDPLYFVCVFIWSHWAIFLQGLHFLYLVLFPLSLYFSLYGQTIFIPGFYLFT